MTMRAIKPFRYATRMLKAGDTFEPRGSYEARVLVAMRRAVHATADEPKPEDIHSLRSAYQAKFGKKAFNGWDADMLRKKLSA